MNAKRPLGSLSRVAFETNCRTDPVPLVATLTNKDASWFLGSGSVVASDKVQRVGPRWPRSTGEGPEGEKTSDPGP